MKIRRIEIERFRGIKHLEWNPGGDILCLVGACDSTKTTILDAIELALSPRYNIQFYDTDFYDAKTDQPIQITVTVSDVPDALKSEQKYGYLARGWSTRGTLHDEPADDDEIALSIRLEVDSSLEPSWTVVNDRNCDGKPIRAKDRESLGCSRLGEYLDRHFSWGRGAILARFTPSLDSLSSILANASRAARRAMSEVPRESLENMYEAAENASLVGREFGVAARSDYRPHLDVQAVSVGAGGLSLHDGEVPVRLAGLGTRRLLALAMEREVAKAGGVTLIDEIEHGLEPHRIRRVLRLLRGTDGSENRGQVFMTTHAPVVLEELTARELRVVRSTEGVSRILDVDQELQPVIRKASEAFLARKILVCEGRTELGLCRCLDGFWSGKGKPSFALQGVALADGRGSQAPKMVKALKELEFDVALLGDSDRPLDPDKATLEAAGAHVFQWDGNKALEERIVQDLPWEGVAGVVSLAMETWGEESVRDAIAGRLKAAGSLTGDPVGWPKLDVDESDLRNAIGKAAKQTRKGWFKRVDLAEKLCRIVIEHGYRIQKTDLAKKIKQLRKWAHSDE